MLPGLFFLIIARQLSIPALLLLILEIVLAPSVFGGKVRQGSYLRLPHCTRQLSALATTPAHLVTTVIVACLATCTYTPISCVLPPLLLHQHHHSIPSGCLSSITHQHPYSLFHPHQQPSAKSSTSTPRHLDTSAIMRTAAIIAGVVALAAAAPAASNPKDTAGDWYVILLSPHLNLH